MIFNVNEEKNKAFLDFKKVWLSFYELKKKHQNFVRHGVLLKVEFARSIIGHADLHPWPEKGEEDLPFHLKSLKEKNPSPLCVRALTLAYEEALSREEGKYLLAGLKIPISHYLIEDIENFQNVDKVLREGFRVFKVKLASPLERQTRKLIDWMENLGSLVRWRVDFYEKLDGEKWKKWLEQFPPSPFLDFIEIPFEYTEKLCGKSSPWPLALDVWESGKRTTSPSLPYLVWKCSRKNFNELLEKWQANLFEKVVFTHSLAHPVDQLMSASCAARFYRMCPSLEQVCGLVQKDIYETHAFSLPDSGPFFPRRSGLGLGFDEMFKHLSWKKWVS